MFARSFAAIQTCSLAGALLATSITMAMAQQNNPAGNLGSNRSATAAPGTADNPAASKLTTGDVTPRRAGVGNYSRSPSNPAKPGATGRTTVPGNNSSVAGAAGSTNMQQSTGTQTSGGGGR